MKAYIDFTERELRVLTEMAAQYVETAFEANREHTPEYRTAVRLQEKLAAFVPAAPSRTPERGRGVRGFVAFIGDALRGHELEC
jgi:hypothetical protein